MYKAIIFDLDGTLLNTIDDLADAVNYVQEQYNWPIHSVEEVKSHVGNGIKNLIKLSIPNGEENPKFEESFNMFREYYQKNCRIKTAPYKGIMELLDVLHKDGYKMAIVSNKAHKAVLELYKIYFEEYVDVAIGEMEDNGIKKKPAPDMIEMAIKSLGVTKEESIYIGDSEVDKATADNSGLECILCQWGFRELEILQNLNPKNIIKEPMELIEILN